MSFWSTLGSLFGVTQGSEGQGATAAGMSTEQQAANAAGRQQGQAQAFANQSYGANAGQTILNATNASMPVAKQIAAQTGNVAGRQTLSAARTAGLNKGQAALEGGQMGGNTAAAAMPGALQQLMGQYQQAAQAQLGAAQQYNINDINAGNAMLNAGSALQGQAEAGGGAILGATGTVVGDTAGGGATGAAGASAAVSDERLKIFLRKDSSPLEALLKSVDPKKFVYKADPAKKVHLGVTAQDLEKSPLKGAVVETPEGKGFDPGQLAGGNLALIIELGHRVLDLERQQRGGEKK